MAWMNQERKAKLAPGIKAVMKKYGMKGTISTDRHSITVTLKSGPLNLIKDFNDTASCNPKYNSSQHPFQPVTYYDINPYWYHEHFTWRDNLSFITELLDAINRGNHDNSDIQSDYFDVGWYVHVKVGKWNKLYEVIQ